MTEEELHLIKRKSAAFDVLVAALEKERSRGVKFLYDDQYTFVLPSASGKYRWRVEEFKYDCDGCESYRFPTALEAIEYVMKVR